MTKTQQAIINHQPWIRCACGHAYSRSQWPTLRLKGIQEVPDHPSLELRQCACGSTLSIEIPAELEAP